MSAVRRLRFVVRNNEEEEKGFGELSLSRFCCAFRERVDQEFLVGEGFGRGARSEPFTSRLFHQVECCDRCKCDHDEVGNHDRETHGQAGRREAGNRQKLVEDDFGDRRD